MALSISQLSFEHHRTPLGIQETKPRITWRFDGSFPNWTQSAYNLEIQRPGLKSPEFFLVNSSESALVPWPTIPLTSGEAAMVRAKAYGQNGQPESPWSKSYSVEAGLLSDNDWAGAMPIASTAQINKTAAKQPVLFRKEFSVAPNVQSARLYITALGLYEAELNGKRVGDAVLAPGWQSYAHRLVYDTYDITDQLKPGSNVIGIAVGEGWYAGRLGSGNGAARNIWGDTIATLSLLSITYANGTKMTVPTDSSWQASTGGILTSSIYDGESYDSRLDKPGWSTAGYLANDWLAVRQLDWPKAKVVAADGPPIRRVEERKLERIIQSASGKTILDFGQNLVGWLRLEVKGDAGTIIKLYHTEVMEKGEVARGPLRAAKAMDTVILNGGGLQTWEPKFTYHGFRYVQVDGWPKNGTNLNENSVRAIVVHSDMEQTGFFQCSNTLFTKLWSNILWSMKGNHMSVPTDCPQRDERLGWTGDANAFAPTANFLYDTAGFVRGWLKDLQSEQFEKPGSIPPFTIPDVARNRRIATAVWGDVAVNHPWNAYMAFGDLDMLREEWPSSQAWVDNGIPRDPASNLWKRGNFQFADWLDPLAPYNDAGAATTSKTYVADAYLVYVTDVLSSMAAALSLTNETQTYRSRRASLATEFQKAWITTNGTVANETQTGLVLPLYFNLFANEGQTRAAAQRLRSIVVRNDFKVGTGFAGTHLLGPTFTKYNLTSDFYRMLSQTGVPSWLYQVVMNGTTTWERWDSMLSNNTINPSDMTSFNHYAFGSVGNWMHSTIGGLSPAAPGWKKIKVAPVPGGNLTSAQAKYISRYGTIISNWRIDDGFHLVVEIPPNTSADVYLPASINETGSIRTIGSGRHEFFVPGISKS